MSVPIQPEATPSTQTPTGPPSADGKTYTQEELNALLAKVRKEEKDKLYPELESYKTQLSQFQTTLDTIDQERKDREAALDKAKKDAEAAEKARLEAEMDAKTLIESKLRETNDTWETRFNELNAERDKERAAAAKERAYNELVDYRNSRLTELADDIAPQFHGFIAGNSREEIDAAIVRAQEATQSIFEQVQQAQQTPPPRGVSPTGYSAFGPLEGVLGQKTLTAADFENMSMAEYEEYRQKSGLAGRQAASQRGLFG